MKVQLITGEQDLQDYDDWILHHPEGNFWQSLERKAYVEALGKKTRLYELRKEGKRIASALVIIDSTAFGLSSWEIPRGPIGERRDVLLEHILEDAIRERCMVLYLSPILEMEHSRYRLRTSNRHIHCEATRIIDLNGSEEEIMNQMKQKGRYNIRLARKHGVTADISDDIHGFLQLIKKTAKRDRFLALATEQYKAFYENIEESFLIMAYHPDNAAKPIAGLLGLVWGQKGIYYYGASDHEYRALMGPYRVQWKAIRHCKAVGAKTYDLLGIAPEGAPKKHPWHGISSFKEKFGGMVVTYPPEQMVILQPLQYWALRLKRKLIG